MRDRRELLLRLAIASEPVSVELLAASMCRDKAAVHQLKGRLEKADGYPVEGGRDGYRLAAGAVDVDLHQFLAGMERVGHATPVGELDQLACMWDGDPAVHHPGFPDATWGPARRALRRLGELLIALPEERRPVSAEHLARIFPRDPVLGALMPAPPRKKLLIVDDTDAGELGDWLSGRYDVITLESLTDWRRFSSESLHTVDAALIDLYLNDRGVPDGLQIVDHLCRRTQIPTALVTAHPPTEVGEFDNVFLQRHRLLCVLPKGLDRTKLYERLDSVTRQLLEDDPDSRLLRLRVELGHLVFLLENRSGRLLNRGRVPAAPWAGDQRRAERAIADRDVDLADQLVSEFRIRTRS